MFHHFFCIYMEMAKKYYQKNKEKLKCCQNVSKEDEEKKRQYGRERYKSLQEDEFRKNFSRM